MDAGVAAILGTLLGGLISAWVTRENLKHQSEQARLADEGARRTARHEYLIWLMHLLVEARAEYERFLGDVSGKGINEVKSGYGDKHAGIVGQAIAVCLAASDDTLRRIADAELTPYFVDAEVVSGERKDYKNRNRDGMRKAVNRLAECIAQLT